MAEQQLINGKNVGADLTSDDSKKQGTR